MNPFILNPTATVRRFTANRIDVGLWTVGSETLVLATNLNSAAVTVSLADFTVQGNGRSSVTQVFDSGVKAGADGKELAFESLGSGAFVVKK